MTEEKARTITTQTLQDHKAMRERLESLLSSAQRMAKPFREIAGALEGSGQSSVAEREIPRLPSEDDIRSTLGEIATLKQEIAALEQEMEAQGFGDYIPSGRGRVAPAPDDD